MARKRSVCQGTSVSKHTLRAGAQHSGQTPSRERSVCQDACVSQHTLRAGAQHSGRRETRVRRRYTLQIITDGVPTHTTTSTTYGLGDQLFFRAAKRTPSPICGFLRWPWCLRPKLGLSTIYRFCRLSMHVASTLTRISRSPHLVELGRVLRNIIGRILYLRRRFWAARMHSVG